MQNTLNPYRENFSDIVEHSNYKTLLIFISIVFILSGCFPDQKDKSYEDVEGVVLLDENPVPNAEIHFRNHYKSTGFIQNNFNENYTFSFNALVDGIYTVSLYRFGSEDPLEIILRDTLSAGRKEFTVPDSLLTNGLYAFEVASPSDQTAGSLFLVNKPDSLLTGTQAVTLTNAEGEFTLKSSHLFLGNSLRTNFAGLLQVTDSLQIYAVLNDTIEAKKSVRVKPNQDNFFEIILD